MGKKRTNFPSYGDDEKISISNSRFKQFDYEYALKLKEEYPKIWKMAGTGGNPPTSFTGNDAFRLWGKYRAGERTPSVLSWIKRREKFASRHYKNKGLKGAIAHVKWGTINASGVSGMKKVINEQKKKINERKSKSLLTEEYSKKKQTLEDLQTFPYTEVLENKYYKEIYSALNDYEASLNERIYSLEGDYGDYLTKPIPKFVNTIKDVLFDSTKYIEDIVLENNELAMSLGLKKALEDFNILDKVDSKSGNNFSRMIKAHSANLKIEVLNSYYNLIEYSFFKNILEGNGFSEFKKDVFSYQYFNKAQGEKTTYIPSFPNKKVTSRNISITETSKWSLRGRAFTYLASGMVTSYIYQTKADERVSTICAPFHNKKITAEEAIGLIPQHQNCRCTLIPST